MTHKICFVKFLAVAKFPTIRALLWLENVSQIDPSRPCPIYFPSASYNCNDNKKSLFCCAILPQ